MRDSKKLVIGPLTFETWRFDKRPFQISLGGGVYFVTLFGRVFWVDTIEAQFNKWFNKSLTRPNNCDIVVKEVK